jgi:hypothetical protein
MTIETQIYTALSGLASNKVYPMVAPDKITAPFIVYSRLSSTPENTLDGGSTIDLVRIQVDTYENTYSAVKLLAESVRLAMESNVLLKATLQSEQDLFEPDLKFYRISQDYYVWQTR